MLPEAKHARSQPEGSHYKNKNRKSSKTFVDCEKYCYLAGP